MKALDPHEACRQLVHLATAVELADFRRDAPHTSVGVWTVLERAAERGDRGYAVKAVIVFLNFASAPRGAQRLVVPSSGPDVERAIEALARSITDEEDLSAFGAKVSDRAADLTIAQHPADDGLSRLVVRSGDEVVYDQVHDFVELTELIPRVMVGDPELVGHVPLIFDGEHYHILDPPCSCGRRLHAECASKETN